MNTSEKIKYLRTQKGLSQEELGKIVGLQKAAINKYETGRVVNIKKNMLQKLAVALDVSPADLLDDAEASIKETESKGRKIPVYGRVAAGIPIEAVENIVDYEEIPASWTGDYGCLVVKGDSMSPRIMEGDVLVVKLQDDAESGDIVVAMINGEDATVKRLIKYADGIMLQALNPAYEPMYFTREKQEQIPVTIWGKVVELRGKF